METRARDVARLPAPAPSRPRLAAVASRETPTTQTPTTRARAHRRVPPSTRAPPRSEMRRRDPIVILSNHASNRSFVRPRVGSISSIPCARVVFVFVFVRTLRPLPCRPNMSSSSSVAVCARRMHPWTTTGRAVASSRARCVSMFNARYMFGCRPN